MQKFCGCHGSFSMLAKRAGGVKNKESYDHLPVYIYYLFISIYVYIVVISIGGTSNPPVLGQRALWKVASQDCAAQSSSRPTQSENCCSRRTPPTHGRLTVSRSVKYSHDWKDERPLSWKRQQCEPSLPQPLHPADGIKRNDETEHQSFVFLLLNHQPVCVFLSLGSLHTSTGHQNQPLNPGILGTPVSYTHLTLPTIYSV